MQTRVSSAYQRVHLLWAAMGFIELAIQSKLLINSKRTQALTLGICHALINLTLIKPRVT